MLYICKFFRNNLGAWDNPGRRTGQTQNESDEFEKNFVIGRATISFNDGRTFLRPFFITVHQREK